MLSNDEAGSLQPASHDDLMARATSFEPYSQAILYKDVPVTVGTKIENVGVWYQSLHCAGIPLKVERTRNKGQTIVYRCSSMKRVGRNVSIQPLPFGTAISDALPTDGL